MLGEIISPEQSTKMSDFATGVANKKRRLRSSQRLPRCSAKLSLQSNQSQRQNDLLNLWLKIWTNYHIVTADNLLEGRTGVANKKQRLRSSQRLPTDLSQSNSMLQNSIQTSINDKHKSEQQMWDEEGMSLSHVNVEYNYSRQLTLNTMIEQKCDDQIRMRGRRFLLCTR